MNIHWVTAVMYRSKKKDRIQIRVFNSIHNMAMTDNKKIASAVGQAYYHMHACPSTNIVDVTGLSRPALEQRSQLNLCGIHTILRAFLYITKQYSDEYCIDNNHVDLMRRYTLYLLFQQDERLCYDQTLKEKQNNYFAEWSKNNNKDTPVYIE